MPDFHPDLKDLVNRMLQVDVSERITIADIKRHPAFRFMLPRCYIVPTPLAFSEFIPSISLESVTPEVYESLGRIGIERDEIVESLSSSESSLIRVFVYCLLHKSRLELERLPWDRSISDISEDEFSSYIDFTFGQGSIDSKNLTVGKRRRSSSNSERCSSPDGFSFATKADWVLFGDDTNEEFDFEKTYNPIICTLPRLIFIVQTSLIRLGFHFFHPSDVELIGHDMKKGFIVVTARIISHDFISLQVQMRNVVVDEVERIFDQIEQSSLLPSPEQAP